MNDAQQHRPGEVCPRCGSGHLRIETNGGGGVPYRTSLRCSQCRRDLGEPTADDYAKWRAS